MTDIIQGMMSVVGNIKTSGESVIDDLGVGLTDALDVIGLNLTENVKDGIVDLKAGVESAVNLISDGADNVWSHLEVQRQLIAHIVSNFETLIRQAVNEVVDLTTGLGSKVENIIGTLSSAMDSVTKQIDTIIRSIKEGLITVVPSISAELRSVVDHVKGMFNSLQPAVRSVIEQVTNSVANVVQTISSNIFELAEMLNDFVSSTKLKITTFLIDVESSIHATFDVMDTRTTNLQNKCDNLITGVESRVNQIHESLSLTSMLKSGTIIFGCALGAGILTIVILRMLKKRL